MRKDLTVKEISEIPADIQKLLGKPPVLPNENPEAYNELRLQIAKSVAPIDFIGWLWVSDITYYTWVILWLRMIKTELVKMGQEDSYLAHCEQNNITDKDKKLEVKKWYQTSDAGTACGFLNELEKYERIDRLLASAEARRNTALREIGRHSESLASRLRKASDDLIDGEFTEHLPASAASGQVMKTSEIAGDHDPGQPACAASGQVAKTNVTPANSDPGKLAPADSGQVKKTNLVKKPILPHGSPELLKGIGRPASLGPKRGAA